MVQLLQMKAKLLYCLLILSLLLNITLVGYLFFSHRELSDKEIQDKFACSRMTQELRDTDVFCDDPSLYREAIQ